MAFKKGKKAPRPGNFRTLARKVAPAAKQPQSPDLGPVEGGGAPDLGLMQGGMITPAMLQQMRMLRYLKDMRSGMQSQTNPQSFM